MGRNTIIAPPWKTTIGSFDDVKRLWSGVQWAVPRRTEGRKHYEEEQFYLWLYLLGLGTHQLLTYPFQVEQQKESESPDFMITLPSGDVTGLEVTRATTQWVQRAMTNAELEYRVREATAATSGEQPEPVSILLSQGVGNEAEAQWCSLVQEAIERKLEKLPGFRPASRYDLLIRDDTPIGGIDRRQVVADLKTRIASLNLAALKFDTISVVISLDVLFDLGGTPRILPYIDLDSPTDDVSERIEHAGWRAAKQAIREHARSGASVYSMDARGRLVKQTSDGKRFEVHVAQNGAEVVVRRLSRE